MNFKKLAEQKIDELSGKNSSKEYDNDSVDLVLEGLDEELSENSSEETFELELDDIDSKEYSQELFDGYLGE